MPRRIARVRVKCSNSASPSPRRMARVSLERSSLKVPSISSTASLLVRNTSRHMVGSEAAMRVKSRKPPAENFITSERVTSTELVRGADDRVGDQVRQMAGDRQHQIVMLGRHASRPWRRARSRTPRACRPRAGRSPSGGVRMHQRLMNSSAKPESGPECSVPATGCAGHEMHARPADAAPCRARRRL